MSPSSSRGLYTGSAGCPPAFSCASFLTSSAYASGVISVKRILLFYVQYLYAAEPAHARITVSRPKTNIPISVTLSGTNSSSRYLHP